MLLRLMWFRKTRPSRFRQSNYKPAIERLEDRALLTASWNSFGGNAQHTEISQVAAQPVNQLFWSTSLDLAPWGAVHYGDPIFTPGNTVIVPVKVTYSGQVQGGNNFFIEGLDDVTGAVKWTSAVTGSITGASNTSPIVITSANNGLANGATVSIGGVGGNTNANGTFTITRIDANTFSLNGTTGNGAYTSGGLWAYNPTSTSYIDPKYSWTPPYQPVYDPVTDRVYFPGPGGTLDYIAHPDSPGSSTPTVVQEAFYGTSNYTANTAAYNASIFINTGLTVDSSGNVYFGFTETGSNPSGINDGGIARITPAGVGSYVLAATAVGQTNDGNWNPALGSSPALSNDGSTLYLGINDAGYNLSSAGQYNGYLVAVNTATMTPQSSVHLLDPSSGSGAGMVSVSTASPVVAPDNTVFLGVFGNPYNGSRGYLLHFSANLSTEYTPGAFGWDDSPSIIPASMVPSYTGSSSYLILAKYNNYAGAETGQPYGGNGVNKIAILDPYDSQVDPNYDPNPNLQVMKEVMTLVSPSPDLPNAAAGDPDAVREWCTNGSVVDPVTDSVFVNNEDGYTYQWNLRTGLITNAVEITSGIGVPYTPTAIGPNGEVFSDNGGTLFALGGYTNYSIKTVSSANPAVVGNSITFTTTLASTNSGPTPTGTVTFSYYEGANNLYNGNTTPVTVGTVNVVNGVATITIPAGLAADHYHVTASYSGDGNYSAGQSTIVLPVLETVTPTVTMSSPNPANPGADVTFTVTVAPNGTTFVPIGTVTLYDNGIGMRIVPLNNLNNSLNPPSTNTATYTAPGLELVGGTNAITAIYNGDQNFTSGTSPVFNEYIPAIITPGTQNGEVGDSVSLQLQAIGLPPGDSWTFSATGLPSGLSINTSTGLISGTITGSASSYSVSVTAADGTKASGSQNFTWNVSALSVTTTTLVASSANTTYGQNETLTATVSSHAGSPNAGTITFYDGTTSLGTVPISNGTAQVSTTTLTAGLHVLTATYSGDGGVTFAGSSSVLSPSSVIQTVGGNGAQGYDGTGIQATFAELNLPQGVAVDSAGNLYIADSHNDIVEKIDAQTHVMTTIAGTGVYGFNGNGIPATSAELDGPIAVAVDSAGNVFIADDENDMVREVSATTGLISTVAGNGGFGYNGDGIPATSAQLGFPVSIALDSAGNLYIADFQNDRIREVSHTTGLISTIAGNGTAGYNGDGIAATSAELNLPDGVTLDAAGDVFIADAHNNRVREVNKATGLISTVAGTGTQGYNGDGIAATSAQLASPSAVAIDASGNLFILDEVNQRVREVTASTGLISTVVGTGTAGYNGDNIAAGSAEISFSGGLAIDSTGNLYIADESNNRIREVAGGYAVVGVTPLVVNPGTQNNAVGDTVSLQVQASGLASGDSWTYSATGLPSGLFITASTGVIAGTVTGSANTYSVTVTATDGSKTSASQSFTWNVSTLSETNPGVQDNAVGDVVSLQVQAGGLPAGDSWVFSAFGLPSGLSINASTGLITGTVTGSANNYSSFVRASDGAGAEITVGFEWVVAYRPSIAAPSSASVTENSSLTFTSANGNQITLSDASAGGGSDWLTVSVSHGTVTLAGTTGLTFLAGANGSSLFTVSGTLGNLNLALNGLTYQPATNYVGSDSVAMQLVDPLDTLRGSTSVPISVNAITAPAITAPSSVTVSENGSLLFSSANGNALSFTDNGAGTNSDLLTMSVSHGTLTLGSTNGLIFTAGSNGAASFTVKGTVTNLNAALSSVTYTPTANYAGPDTLAILVSDPGDTKSGSTNVAINVSPLAPAITAPATAALNENASLVFSSANGNSISVADSGPGASSDALTLSVSHGTLTLATTAGLSFTSGSNGSASFTVTGSVSNLNAALNGLTYQPTTNYSGPDTLSVSILDATDSESATKNVALSVNALAPPSVTAPATASVTQNGSLVFSSANGDAISVSDAAAGGNSDSLTLAVSHGTLTLSTTAGLTFTAGSNGSASFTVTGTVANLNAALSGLTYNPTAAYVGPDSLSISITDPGDSETGSKSVAITVNSASPPSITGPSTATVTMNGTLVLSSTNGDAITVADSGPGSGSDSLTLSVTHGTLTLPSTTGLTFTAGSNGAASFTVTGSLANLNADLNGLSYKPTTGYTGPDTLSASIHDSADNLTGSTTVAITVSSGGGAPSITAPATLKLYYKSTLLFSPANSDAITISDSSAGSSVEQLALSATHGTLILGSTTGITFVNGANNSASMTIDGTLGSLNAALNGLSFTPTKNFIGTAIVTLGYTDLGTGLMGSATITISVVNNQLGFVQTVGPAQPDSQVIPVSSPPVSGPAISSGTPSKSTSVAVGKPVAPAPIDTAASPKPDLEIELAGFASALRMLME
jgi:hypothetical protein